jgi:hypothetical protein
LVECSKLHLKMHRVNVKPKGKKNPHRDQKITSSS